ncbi:MAG: HNH endonuclease [Lachnospiraceae bacterium]|nr:HNH endonuclease [Lachnospiraceae bacterium]
MSSNYRKTGLETNPSNYGWYRCVHCGKSFRKGSIDIDHIIPQSKGGMNNPENLQFLCVHCNRSKGNKMDQVKSDLKTRSSSYKQYQRSEVLKPMIAEKRKDIRELKKQFSDQDIVRMLNDTSCKKNPEFYREILKEAKKCGIKV